MTATVNCVYSSDMETTVRLATERGWQMTRQEIADSDHMYAHLVASDMRNQDKLRAAHQAFKLRHGRNCYLTLWTGSRFVHYLDARGYRLRDGFVAGSAGSLFDAPAPFGWSEA